MAMPFKLHCDANGDPMINVGLTDREIDNLILLIDDFENEAEPDEAALAEARKKLIGRKSRLADVLVKTSWVPGMTAVASHPRSTSHSRPLESSSVA